MKPATSVARTVFISASRFGDRPASSAFASLSEAARVARPKRVYLYSAQSSAAMTMTMPVSQNRSAGMAAPATSTMSFGSRPGASRPAVP